MVRLCQDEHQLYYHFFSLHSAALEYAYNIGLDLKIDCCTIDVTQSLCNILMWIVCLGVCLTVCPAFCMMF